MAREEEKQPVTDWLAGAFRESGALEDSSGWQLFVERVQARLKEERLEGFRAARKAFKASRKHTQESPRDVQEASGTMEPDPGGYSSTLPESGPQSAAAVASFHAGSGTPLGATPEPSSPMEAMIQANAGRVARGEPTRRTRPTRAAVPPGRAQSKGESESG
jgi:hypothetical protein